tara:strand:+ start:57 stop:482 length:426 start_codon:yes stop_codon:yes gene_type:complete
MKHLVILIMLFSNLVFSEDGHYYIITSTTINDGEPYTSIILDKPLKDLDNKSIPFYIRMIPHKECDAELYKLYRWHKKQISEGKEDYLLNRTVKIEIIEDNTFPDSHIKVLIEKERNKKYYTCTLFPIKKDAPMTQIIKAK